MARSVESSNQRRIPFPVATVFEVIADPETQNRWFLSAEQMQREELSVRYASGPRVGTGSRFIRLREDPEGHQKVERLETVVYEAPYRIRFSDGASFVLEEDGDDTVLTAFDEKPRGSAVGGLVRRMLRSEPQLASPDALAGRLERIEQVIAARAPATE